MCIFFGCHSSPMDGFESCVLWFVGYASPISFHLEDSACVLVSRIVCLGYGASCMS